MKKQLIAVPINDIEDTLQIGLIPSKTPAMNWQQGSNWWQQSMGVMRVRNGFTVQGLLSLPVPQRVLSRKQSTTEPVCLH
jgi:hypothetical protein